VVYIDRRSLEQNKKVMMQQLKKTLKEYSQGISGKIKKQEDQFKTSSKILVYVIIEKRYSQQKKFFPLLFK
jgi:hypothetical protein